MDFGLLPPEVNSARMYTGPGAGPLLSAAACWEAVAAELESTAAGYTSQVSGLTGQWLGPSSMAMAAAATRYVAWLQACAAEAGLTAAQAYAAVAAYEVAFGMTVPPPVIAANRALKLVLVATNFFGQNTAAIAATEAQYLEMWIQDAVAMYGYAADSATASTLTAFDEPPQTTNPTGQVAQGRAMAQTAATNGVARTQSLLTQLGSLDSSEPLSGVNVGTSNGLGTGVDASVGGANGVNAGVGSTVGGSSGVDVSVGGSGGVNAGVGASVGGVNGDNAGLGLGTGVSLGGINTGVGSGTGVGASVGGATGVNAGVGASVGGSSGVNAGVGASVGGTSGVNAGVGASVGGSDGGLGVGASVGGSNGVDGGVGASVGGAGGGNAGVGASVGGSSGVGSGVNASVGLGLGANGASVSTGPVSPLLASPGLAGTSAIQPQYNAEGLAAWAAETFGGAVPAAAAG